MHWIKKTVFGMAFTSILFIIIQFGGAGLFSAEFLGFGGLVLLLAMGAIETNLILYE